jgi:hypothetical protein
MVPTLKNTELSCVSTWEGMRRMKYSHTCIYGGAKEANKQAKRREHYSGTETQPVQLKSSITFLLTMQIFCTLKYDKSLKTLSTQ